MMELHVLQCLFVRGYNKKQWRGRIISNFTKGETFFITYDNQVLLGVISQCGPPSCTLQKGHLLLFSLTKKRIYLDTQLKVELTDLFWKLLILTSRNMMMSGLCYFTIHDPTIRHPTMHDSCINYSNYLIILIIF